LNAKFFDFKDTMLVDITMKYFLAISQDQMNKNIDSYVDYCKANKNIKAKDGSGNELNGDDTALRDELMILRLNISNTKHVQEKEVFTDKMLDRILYEKPTDIIALKKIISPASAYHYGDKILEAIMKHL
jgi:hypothetical protein